ncbi:hypothetical protein I4F81_007347 [Pyropia yezoensis]|uniref:Uncharacterized protein n=1 Tax=Pyropia yezoensis TaxID=2788 RepID=A0ACC3C3V4_PYRYE|nr:hypothetical protein I4F81_007347 [Neopyropia yezoensis]
MTGRKQGGLRRVFEGVGSTTYWTVRTVCTVLYCSRTSDSIGGENVGLCVHGIGAPAASGRSSSPAPARCALRGEGDGAVRPRRSRRGCQAHPMTMDFRAAEARLAAAFLTGLAVGGTSMYLLWRPAPAMAAEPPAPQLPPPPLSAAAETAAAAAETAAVAAATAAAAAATAAPPSSSVSSSAGGGVALILNAAAYAAVAHRGQRRKNVTAAPYIEHPLGVAALLAEAGFTHPPTLAAAMLHDTVEDTAVTPEELVAVFGPEVAAIVAEVTDDKSLCKADRKAAQIAAAPRASAAAQAVKLADKLHNLTDLLARPPVGWAPARVADYFAWAARVIDGCRGGVLRPPTPSPAAADALLGRVDAVLGRVGEAVAAASAAEAEAAEGAAAVVASAGGGGGGGGGEDPPSPPGEAAADVADA